MSNDVGIITVGHNPDALDIAWQKVFQPHSVSLPTPPRPKCMACKTGHSNYTATSPVLAPRLILVLGTGGDQLSDYFFIGSVQWGQVIEMAVDG